MSSTKKFILSFLLLMLSACQDSPPLPVRSTPPTDVRVEAGNGEVRLRWQGSAGATGYNVYRSESSRVEVKAANRRNATLVTTTTFSDEEVTNGQTYYYVVTSVGPGGESGASSKVEARPGEAVPAAPTELEATAGDGRVMLSWRSSPDVESYNVYRSESRTVATAQANLITTVRAPATSHLDRNVVNGNTYYYAVTALAESGRESAKSDTVSATPRVEATPPNQAPTVDAGPDKSLTWPNNTVTLEGQVADDGLPDPPGKLTTLWTKVSGPGTVVFEDASSSTTTASFSGAGTYVLRLTAHDGELESGDEVTITLRQASEDFTVLRWTAMRPHPLDLVEAQGIAVNGKLYVFGGYTGRTWRPIADAHVYDPRTDSWTRLRSLPTALTHGGTTTDGKDVFIAGGYIFENNRQVFGTKEVWRYNVSTDSYTALPDLPVERAAGQLEYLGGKLHFFGGTNKARTQDAGDHWVLSLDDLAAGWKPLAPLPNPRNHLGAAVLGGKIYAVGGGRGHDDDLVTQSDVHVYDPAVNSWTKVASLPKPLSHIAAATFVEGGRIIVAGGEVARTRSVEDVVAYDPGQNSWQPLTPLPARRFSGVAGAIDGNIYFTGGNFSRATYQGVPLR